MILPILIILFCLFAVAVISIGISAIFGRYRIRSLIRRCREQLASRDSIAACGTLIASLRMWRCRAPIGSIRESRASDIRSLLEIVSNIRRLPIEYRNEFATAIDDLEAVAKDMLDTTSFADIRNKIWTLDNYWLLLDKKRIAVEVLQQIIQAPHGNTGHPYNK